MFGKRYICAMVLLGAGILSGCAQNTENEAPKTYAEAELFCDVDFWKPPAWSEQSETVTGKISKATGLKLNVNVPASDGDAQLSARLVNGNLPDLITVLDKTTIKQLTQSGKVWKLEEFLKKYKPDSHLLKRFPEDIKRELIKRDGDWYAYPSHLDSEDAREIWQPSDQYFEDYVEYREQVTIMWNKELLDRFDLSVDDLQTEEQVLNALGKVKGRQKKEESQDIIPVLIDGENYQSFTLQYLVRTFGAEYVDADGNYTDPVLQPEMKDALRFFWKLLSEEYVSPEQMLLSNRQVQELMASKKVLCFIGNVSNAGVVWSEWVSSGVMMPSNGKIPVHYKNNRVGTGWLSTFISKDCKHPEEIAAFLDYMTSDEGLLLWGYGEEGKDYELDANGLVVETEEGLEKKRNYSTSGIFAWWVFANNAWERSIMAPVLKGSTKEEGMEIEMAYAKDPRVVICDGSLLQLNMDVLESNPGYEELKAKIDACKNERIARVILSETTEEFERNYEDMLTALQESGIEELNHIKNEQYQKNCKEYNARIEKVN